ncbi:hypothetical protein [Caballeronia grimmiae]|uniref:hypothetical protein n=2 Tax=Caballeronia TaxID=1827195 RepID=UPI001FD2ACD1|nr:hypothetical protein [Caballeronia grimmiae]
MAIEKTAVQVEVTSGELTTLIAALDALLRERGMAYRIASDYLLQQDQPIDQQSFGISNIMRIKRSLEERLSPVNRV